MHLVFFLKGVQGDEGLQDRRWSMHAERHVSIQIFRHLLLRVPAHEKSHPIQLDFFGAQAIVQTTNAPANLFETTIDFKGTVPGFVA